MSPVDSVADKPRVPRDLPADHERSPAGDRDSADRRDGAIPGETARPADSLRQRMDHLPAGHPSSPYEADGRLRQPTPRLRDLHPADGDEDPGRAASGPAGTGDNAQPPDASDNTAPGSADDLEPTPRDRPPPDIKPRPDHESPPDSPRAVDQTRPLTDAEWADHRGDIRDRLGKAGVEGLATNRQYTTDLDNQQWTAARDRIQGDLVAELYERSSHVPCDRLAIVAGGLSGAGKTTVLGEHAGIDLSQYLTVNPDNIKEEMARRGLVPEIEGLSPMEASDLIHEESSVVAKQLARKAIADGKNIIWDITMSSGPKTAERITDLHGAGYTVGGIFVDIPIETSIRRSDARHREGHEDYRAGKGQGGRYVPREIIEAQADPDWESKNRKIFEDVKHLFDRWSRYDNSVDDQPALLTEVSPTDDRTR